MTATRPTRKGARVTGSRARMHPRRRVRSMFIVSLLVLTVFAAQLVRLQGFDAAAIDRKSVV